MNADGGAPTRLTESSGDTGNGDPSYAPDGSKIAFTSSRNRTPGENRSNTEIYSMDANGGAETRLTTSPNVDTTYSWSGTPLPASSDALPSKTYDRLAEGSPIRTSLVAPS
jgi:Tol biopolymer transport system component